MEIKYRIRVDGEFYYECFCAYMSGYGCMFNQTTNPQRLMQFSGLKDSKGVDLYEGDIVSLAGYGDYEVEFPFLELYEAYGEGDIGEIKGNTFDL